MLGAPEQLQAILSEEERLVCIRFGHDYDPQCMMMDEILYAVSENIKNFCVRARWAFLTVTAICTMSCFVLADSFFDRSGAQVRLFDVVDLACEVPRARTH